MATLWREEYRTGIAKIDEQHYLLFQKIEHLLDIARSGDESRSRKESREILNFLVDYTAFHFETEEGLLRDRGYSSYAEHIRIHEEFKNTVMAYKKLLTNDYSVKALKKFIGVLIAWLVNHVCVCDRKIIKNIPIRQTESFSDTESYIRKVTQRILTRMYGIRIRESRSYIYKGDVNGDVIIRTLVEGSRRHLLVFGMSDQIAKLLFQKFSGMMLLDVDRMDEVEKSAFIEVGDIVSAYIMSAIEDTGEQTLRFNSSLYLHEFDESEYNIYNSLALEFMTDYGKVDILYSPAEQA